ncbi:hypothetical protein HRbin10_01997 [bacterium HR10]|nr:hypothetical protein HRbin10_01997 [bacterium HR10]
MFSGSGRIGRSPVVGVTGHRRKVRTPQGSGLGNAQAGRPQGRPDDKCNREQTGRWPPFSGRERWIRRWVKRWGKSPPAGVVTRPARQTPRGARPNRKALEGGPPDDRRPHGRAMAPSGRSLELTGNRQPRGMTAIPLPCGRQNSAYRFAPNPSRRPAEVRPRLRWPSIVTWMARERSPFDEFAPTRARGRAADPTEPPLARARAVGDIRDARGW